MSIIYIDPGIVAFEGEDLPNGKLVLGRFLVNAEGLVFLTPPKPLPEPEAFNVEPFNPWPEPTEEELPADPTERENYLKEYKQAEEESRDMREQTNKLRLNMHQISAQFFIEARDSIRDIMFPEVNMYLIEQTMKYIEEKMIASETEKETLELYDLFENVAGIIINNQENLGGVYIDSPYVGENYSLDQYAESVSKRTSQKDRNAFSEHRRLKDEGYYSGKNPHGILVIG